MEKLEKVIIGPELSIKQALKQMDVAAGKIIFVVNTVNRLLGSVTDGDIRRWILKGGDLTEGISRVMNNSPAFLKEGYSREEAKNLMVTKGIECIPIVDDQKRIISAIWWVDFFEKTFRKHEPIHIPVVIMAGGEGTRLLPVTHVLPKPLIPIGGKPIIELIIERFQRYGCLEFYLTVNYKANMLKAYFSDFEHEYKINYVYEEKPLGTIGSLSLLKNCLKDAFFVSNCDILIDADYSDILRFHRENGNMITLIVSMKHYIIPYGICDIKEGGVLKGIKEKPEYDFLVNTGSYLIEPEVLKDIPENTSYHATDLIGDYIKKGKKIKVYPVSDKSWLDMGQWGEYQKMLKLFEAQ